MNEFMGTEPVLQAQGLVKRFFEGPHEITILHGVDLTIARGDFVSIVGSSGSGKSTLLHLLGGLDVPNAGEVHLLGQPFSRLDETRRGDLRNAHLGFVYQFHHLLPEFDALENVAMPLLIRPSVDVETARAQADVLLKQVGLGHRQRHRPGELSGGERQRVAIARALATSPQLVLADEPTGNLDQRTAQEVLGLLDDLRAQHGMALLVVTHDERLAAAADRRLVMQDGRWHLPTPMDGQGMIKTTP